MSAPALRPAQVAAVEWLRAHDRGMLAGEMRTGKTAAVLTALEPRHLPALVVSTRAIAERVWVEEAAVWRPDLDVSAARGSAARRAEILRGGADVVSLSVASLDDHQRAGDLGRFRTLVLDESTLVKSPGSSRHLAARRAAAGCSVVWALTGTPVPGSTVDLWGQWRVIDGGRRLGRSVTAHRDRWQTAGHHLPSGAVVGREDRPGAVEGVCALVADATHVMLADEAGRGVPCEVVVHVRQVRMGEWWSRAYRRLRRRRVWWLDGVGPDGPALTADSAGVLRLRLRQLLTGEVPDADGVPVATDPARVDEAVEAVLDARAVSPTAVAYGFVSERDRMRARLEAEGLVCAEVREPGAVDAWRAGDLDVLLLHPASAGHGLTLHRGGCEMVWLTMPWSLEQWEQACARLTVWGEDPADPPRSVRVTVIESLLDDGSPTVDREVAERLSSRAATQRAAKRRGLRT